MSEKVRLNKPQRILPKLEILKHSSFTVHNDESNNDKIYLDDDDESFKESHYGWLVLLTTIWCYGVIIGLQNNYSIIYFELIQFYNHTNLNVVYAAWIGSTSNGLQFFCCIPASFLIELYGPRVVAILGGLLSTIGLGLCALVKEMEFYFLTYSILFGIGQALLLISTLTILPHYFKKRLGLATGIMSLGSATITICIPVLTAHLLEKLNFTYVWTVLASISFVTIMCGVSFKPRENEKGKIIEIEKQVPLKEKLRNCFGVDIFKNKPYVIWCFGSFIGIFGNMIPTITMNHFSSLYFPIEHEGVLLNIAFAVASGVSALVFGKIADKTKFSRIYYHIGSFFIFGIAEILMVFVPNFKCLLAVVSVLGLCDGLYLCVLMPILLEITDMSNLTNQATGYYHACISIPVVIGPIVSGFIFESTNSYNIAYFIGGSTCILCAIILLLVPNRKFCIKESEPKLKHSAVQRKNSISFENPNFNT